ncbi:glycosyltransferase family 2 protein [Flavobacterium sp.]|uniref:glycosyltransferase family 2 protein n=1 Tax=Flavobacterium sp. TaxID=239 RepID=UPI003D2B0E3B
MKKPLVSIIIPLYNRELSIIDTLQSVLAQSYENWECIIVDDGSTDNSFETVQRFIKKEERFVLVKRDEKHKKGGNGARNYGFELSKGDFVNWIDSDDTIHEDFILEKINAFNESTEVVISKTVFTNTENQIIKKETRTQLTENVLEDFITLKTSWYTFDPLWKKSFLLKTEVTFNEDLLKGQDRDFHVRILVNKPIIKIIDKYLYYYKTNPNSISTSSSMEVVSSILNESIKRNKILLKHKVSNQTKLFLLKQQLRTYATLYKTANIYSLYKEVLSDLFVFNFSNIVVLFKFVISIISFKLINKGDVILKSM